MLRSPASSTGSAPFHRMVPAVDSYVVVDWLVAPGLPIRATSGASIGTARFVNRTQHQVTWHYNLELFPSLPPVVRPAQAAGLTLLPGGVWNLAGTDPSVPPKVLVPANAAKMLVLTLPPTLGHDVHFVVFMAYVYPQGTPATVASAELVAA